MIAFVRVDSRLIHGQVIEAWLPYLKVGRILVADDEAARNPLTRAAMGMAVPARVQVEIRPLQGTDFGALESGDEPALLLLREVAGAVYARRHGLACPTLNLGNVHFAPGRAQVTPSVFLSPEELGLLEGLAGEGVAVELRAVPRERPMPLGEILSRAGGAPSSRGA